MDPGQQLPPQLAPQSGRAHCLGPGSQHPWGLRKCLTPPPPRTPDHAHQILLDTRSCTSEGTPRPDLKALFNAIMNPRTANISQTMPMKLPDSFFKLMEPKSYPNRPVLMQALQEP
ncbi:hypothetical protein QTO34_015804 [Cnephaeus nilssonii]|uniref:Uncharacterized protein n=1 Tax=Cnephaeus nilssonii TaxID=3371016 RepID=A0AA40LTI0_CNENI|nr:hypothetical protein QTO34_015804 [Eptesicus nilssonii]